MENNCLEVTNDLHQLLIRVLQREHGFQFFGDPYFEIVFPIDKYVN